MSYYLNSPYSYFYFSKVKANLKTSLHFQVSNPLHTFCYEGYTENLTLWALYSATTKDLCSSDSCKTLRNCDRVDQIP